MSRSKTLQDLSEAATPGELRVSPTHWGFTGLTARVPRHLWDGNLKINGEPHLKVLRGNCPEGLSYPDAAFIVQLWNDFRSGKLRYVDTNADGGEDGAGLL